MAMGLLGPSKPEVPVKAVTGFSQTSISRMDNLSSDPLNYSYVDWRDKTERYINFLFNQSNTVSTPYNGSTLIQPVSWLATAPNVNTYFGETGNRIIAFPSYFGMRTSPNTDTYRGEGIAVLASVLSASLIGYDMTNYRPEGTEQDPLDYVKQMVNYYAIHNNERVVLNNSSSNTGGSWWYELLPSALFTCLASIYMDKPDYNGTYLEDILLNMARQWYGVAVAAGGANANFSDRKSYSIRNGTFTSGGWSEPDAAAGIAFVLYMAYSHFKDKDGYSDDIANFLNGAKWCMNFLNNLSYNPFYEVLIYFAPYVAARMNLEQGTSYGITKMINWTLDGSSAVRGGWGMVNQNWGNFNTQGLMGSLTDGDGYSFMMNTFDAALGFFPMVKYSPQYAKSIGKWVLNVSDSAKNYYPDYLPNANQTCRQWATTNGTGSFVAYEGLRRVNKINSSNSPAGWGDPLDYNWGPLTDFGYGNNHVGFFASIESTNVSKILRTNLNAHDFFQDNLADSYLYYNPYNSYQNIEIDLAPDQYLFNVMSGQKENLTNLGNGKYSFSLGPDSSSIMVVLNDADVITFEGETMKADGSFVARVRAPFDTVNPLLADQSGTLSLSLNYPEFMKPDRVKLLYANEQIGDASVIGNASSVNLGISYSGNGYLPTRFEFYKSGRLLEAKDANILLFDGTVTPLLNPATNSALQTMFAQEYTTWNANQNPDRGSADVYRANATLVEGGTRLRLSSNTWGVAGTSKVMLNFDQLTLLKFNVNAVSHRWTVKVFVAGGDQWGYYLQGEISSLGTFVLDIEATAKARSSAFNFSGVRSCYIWFIPVGASNAEMTISDLSVYSVPQTLEASPLPASSSSSEETSSSEVSLPSSETSVSSSEINSSSETNVSSSSLTSSSQPSVSSETSSEVTNEPLSTEKIVAIASISTVNVGAIIAIVILKKKKLF